MAGFQIDDRVKVGGTLGTVRWVNPRGHYIDIKFDGRGWVTEYVPVELVEKIERTPRVGDAIEGAAAHDALPLGAVVALDGAELIMRTAKGYAGTSGHTYPAGLLSVPRTIKFLPA